MSRWEPQKNIEFIKQYKQQQCLWDPNHGLYKNKDARKAAYMEIKEVMNMGTVREVILRIRMLRNTFNNELKKENFQRRKSKIEWLPYMGFIKRIDCEGIANDVAQVKSKEVQPQIPIKSINSLSTPQRQYQPVTRNSENSLVRAVEALENVVSNRSKTDNDEFDLFGQNVAHQLRQMPLGAALETEEMILAIIRKRRVKLANQQMQIEVMVDDEVRVIKEESSSDEEDGSVIVGSNPLENC